MVSASDQRGCSIAAITMFSASWIVDQLSTRVLSQSNKIASGRTTRSIGSSSDLQRAVAPENAKRLQLAVQSRAFHTDESRGA